MKIVMKSFNNNPHRKKKLNLTFVPSKVFGKAVLVTSASVVNENNRGTYDNELITRKSSNRKA